MTEPLAPGALIGVLGGGQLGRMLAAAASRMGMRCRVYDPDPNAPAAALAEHVCAGWDNDVALDRFARGLDACTLEFENIPVATLRRVAEMVRVAPSAATLAIAQDRVAEKAFLNEAGVDTAPWVPVEDIETLRAAIQRIGLPAVLKTRRLGYDGKGQSVLREASDAGAALEAIHGAPAILEGFVGFDREISVVAARGRDGSVACYDPAENIHEGGVLRRSSVPAFIDADTAERAQAIAASIMGSLGYVGVMGVELFHLHDGRLLANEIAPRVHNTGHWTSGACAVDQFEQHIRAVCFWPLGDPVRHADAEMENLLGDAAETWPALAREPGAMVTLYGKAEARPGRKMGHVTRLKPRF